MDILESHVAEEDERTRYLIQVAQATSEQRMVFPLARITTCGTLTIQILQAIRVRADGQQEAVYGPLDPALFAKKGASTVFTLLDLFQRKGTSASDRCSCTGSAARSCCACFAHGDSPGCARLVSALWLFSTSGKVVVSKTFVS